MSLLWQEIYSTLQYETTYVLKRIISKWIRYFWKRYWYWKKWHFAWSKTNSRYCLLIWKGACLCRFSSIWFWRFHSKVSVLFKLGALQTITYVIRKKVCNFSYQAIFVTYKMPKKLMSLKRPKKLSMCQKYTNAFFLQILYEL